MIRDLSRSETPTYSFVWSVDENGNTLDILDHPLLSVFYIHLLENIIFHFYTIPPFSSLVLFPLLRTNDPLYLILSCVSPIWSRPKRFFHWISTTPSIRMSLYPSFISSVSFVGSVSVMGSVRKIGLHKFLITPPLTPTSVHSSSLHIFGLVVVMSNIFNHRRRIDNGDKFFYKIETTYFSLVRW